MTLTSKPLAVILLAVMFVGIFFSSLMGWWATESTKVPANFTEGEFAGQANPADIRGSYTFGDIANSFDITPDLLAQAFNVQVDDPAGFAIKDLETLYAESEFEVGTASVRLFVAWYTGVPFDIPDEEIYLPRSAKEILLTKNNLTSDQLAYLETYTVDMGQAIPVTPEVSEPETKSSEYVLKGKTTFGDLIRWGVAKETIEELIGTTLPDPAMTLKDYASTNGLDFETLKTALQTEVDKVKP